MSEVAVVSLLPSAVNDSRSCECRLEMRMSTGAVRVCRNCECLKELSVSVSAETLCLCGS